MAGVTAREVVREHDASPNMLKATLGNLVEKCGLTRHGEAALRGMNCSRGSVWCHHRSRSIDSKWTFLSGDLKAGHWRTHSNFDVAPKR